MYEIYLSYNNNQEKLQLPVSPSSISYKTPGNNTKENIVNLGDINIIGKTGLGSITINSYFPNPDKDYKYKGSPKPWDCVELINKWMKTGKPIRLIILNTIINSAMVINEFNWVIDNATGNIKYSLDLEEYRFINGIQNNASGVQGINLRQNTKTQSIIYIVQAIDTLYTIARRVYGNGSLWQTIVDKNPSIKSNDNLIVGQKINI